MTVHLTYRIPGATAPVATTEKGSPLTNAEIDGNLKSLKDNIELSLDNALPIANYTALRDYPGTGTATTVRITTPGIAGFFTRRGTTGLTDNGGTVILDAGGRAWERVFDGAVSVKWFGAGAGVLDDTAKFVAACSLGKLVNLPAGSIVLVKDAVIPNDVHINIEKGARLKCIDGAVSRIAQFNGSAHITGAGEVDGNRANQSNRPKGLVFAGGFAAATGINFTGCKATSISVENASCDLFIDRCTFENLAPHGGTTGQDSIHVYVTDAKNVKITDNIFSHPTITDPEKNPGGIHITGTTGTSCVINGNTFTNIGQSAEGNLTGCIDLYTYADETIVSNNIVKSATYAVALKLQNSKNLICADNIVVGYSGIQPIPSTAFILINKARSYSSAVSTFVVTGNIVDDSVSSIVSAGQGISVSGRLNGDSSVDPVDKVIISNNHVKGRNSGILVQYAADSLITSNHVANSRKGIEIGAHNTLAPVVTINGNNVTQCEFGVTHASSDLANASVLVSSNIITSTVGVIHINIASSVAKMVSRLVVSDNLLNGAVAGYNVAASNVSSLTVTNNMSTATSQTTMYRDNVTAFIENGNSWNKGVRLVDGESAPTTLVGSAYLYVDSADGDLKIKFGDGVVKTISVDV